MNKKHIITSIGVSFLAIGAIGGIWSGIQAMPKVINNVQMARAEQEEKEVLYKSEEKITKLNIDSNVSHVSIKKHDKPYVIVERSGNKEMSSITTEGKNNELSITEEPRTITKETKNIDDMVKYFIEEIYSSYSSEITVYLPEKVNADIKTDYQGLIIEDDIFLETLNYETSSGYITIRSDLNLENLNIKSLSDISLTAEEMSGIRNVKVTGNSVNIHGNTYIDEESNIAENLEIKTTSNYYDSYDVSINSNAPVAKNIVIDSGSTVAIDLPIVDYKFNFDVKSSRGIKFEASDYDKYNNTPLETYFKDTEYEDGEKGLIRDLNGLINEEVKDNQNEYFIKIKSAYTVFY